MGYKDFVNRFSTTPLGVALASRVASRLDPLIYKASGGRFTSTGVPTIPQLVLTTTGRKSGLPREVQVGYARIDGDHIVVASNFGKERHPAWSYNLAAEPRARIVVDGETIDVVAERLTDAEKDALWPTLEAHVPQFRVYVTRTARNIRVFRLRRA